MPGMDGLAATRAIRAREQQDGTPPLPIVAMTASVLAAHREAAANAGMDGFASKPVDWHTLSHEIARVLKLAPLASASAPSEAARQRVLNQKAGLQRWADQEDAYHQALHRFVADYSTTAATLAKLLGGDSDSDTRPAGTQLTELRLAEAQAWCHKARGVAANVGLEQLAATLAQIERLCGSPQRDGEQTSSTLQTELAQAQRTLAAQLDAALSAIHALAPPRGKWLEAPTPAPAFDLAVARHKSAALLPFLQRGALNDAALTALTAALTGAPPELAQQLSAVQDALNDFDFPQAQAALQTLQASLSTENP
jgi:CheY-like chemotaxis protein